MITLKPHQKAIIDWTDPKLQHLDPERFITLYKHQQKILDINPKKYGIFWQGGLGKTILALELAKKNNQDALIICPKLIKLTWERECLNYSDQKHKIVSKEEFRRDWDKYSKYNMTIIDESHFFSHKSKMTNSLLKYNRKHNSEYRYLLTGTPYSDPFSIYYQAQHLGYIWNWRTFRDTFYYYIPMGSRMIPVIKKNIEEKIKNLINIIGETLLMDEVFDVPEQIFKIEYFNLTKEQEKAIQKVKESETIHIVKWTKVYQLMGGTLKGNEYEPNVFVKSEKLERLIELVSENNKIIVVCRFNNEIKYIKENLEKDKPIFIINGEVKTKDKTDIIDKLKFLDKYCVLVNSACCEGWEAPSCPLMVFYSVSFDLKSYLQMQWRIHRANNLKRNYYISLVVANTIDEEVNKKLFNKLDFHIELYN